MQEAGTNTAGLSKELRQRLSEFQTRFIKVAAITMAAMSLTLVVLSLLRPDNLGVVITASGGAAAGSVVTYGLAHQGRLRLATHLFATLIYLAATLAIFVESSVAAITTLGPIMMLVVVIASFILGRRGAILYGGLGSMGIVLLKVASIQDGQAAITVILSGVTNVSLLLMVVVSMVLFQRQYSTNLGTLENHLDDVDRVMERARRIADGDLSGEVEGNGDVSQIVQSMLVGLRDMVLRFREMLNGLASTTTQIAAMAREQEQGAFSQVNAVEQIGKTLTEHAEMSRALSSAIEKVFADVAETKQTNELISEHIGTLIAQTQRISDILEIIKDVANKSEILALNAALEGAKAGEAGTGFSLVANQMQRLAESVSQSVKDVRALTGDIRDATRATVMSTEQGTKLATSATEAAHQISVVSKQQQESTEQVNASVGDIVEVSNQMLAGSSQTLAAIKELTRMSQEMNELLASYEL